MPSVIQTAAEMLQKLQDELTHVNQALLTAAGGEFEMLDAWAQRLRAKIAAIRNGG